MDVIDWNAFWGPVEWQWWPVLRLLLQGFFAGGIVFVPVTWWLIAHFAPVRDAHDSYRESYSSAHDSNDRRIFP